SGQNSKCYLPRSNSSIHLRHSGPSFNLKLSEAWKLKLRPTRSLRQSLRDLVPDAFYRIEPEDSFAGMEDAVPLWDDDNSENGRLVDPAGMNGSFAGDGETDNRALEEIFEFGADIDSEFARTALGGTSGEQIRQSVMLKGVDALAFYVTLHAKGG